MKRLESRKRSTQLDWRWVCGSVGAQSKLDSVSTHEAGLFSAAEARSGSALDAPAARPRVSTRVETERAVAGKPHRSQQVSVKV